MKRTNKLLISMATVLVVFFSFMGGAFAESINRMLIPDLPKQSYRYGVGAYEGVVAHSTATPEAPAINIRNYEARTWRNAFVHFAVDWNETIQIADTKYIAYGAGPAANKRFVHVELSESSNPAKFKSSYERYVKLLAKILKDNGLTVEQGLWTHEDVTRKLGGTDHEDPRAYLASHGISIAQFRADVKKAYGNNEVSVVVPEKPTKPEVEKPNVSVTPSNGVAYIDGTNVNLRKGPSADFSKIRKLNKPEAYQVWGEVNGPNGKWLNLGGDQWIKYDSSYIRYDKGSNNENTKVVGKRVVSKVNDLNFYTKATWNKSYLAGTVDAGLGFTIDAKVDVNGYPQYKAHNSKGNTYYITASPTYVNVK
ncbi:N-acetylmuramoyl-L-alanine amidase [Bacillus cereus]|uniref:peptidoglycan recognition protein family protein n=1 Tax=Bacillus cereus TaxID=1396 RepID=UPI000BEDD508|nr:peptidoglycan recognition family protein [Bacillus cereus]PDZ36514.1 N-acetylmuramoyl-L-alanine amidase [Bacillus cereus]PEX05785.1 N-acetylmuramoyl-L-alanine amidase [Bacillus cereus]PGQ00186.1 N-acetylmuramoyl-L-alanine amidase [Bacillus cereus]PGS07984.1 N-acetylmuramoyl-L-alanine amidase [Bacillus cereus]PGS64344.1 N-acetylmuramoyl-L-alanine amidase [Bacillus cereus]